MSSSIAANQYASTGTAACLDTNTHTHTCRHANLHTHKHTHTRMPPRRAGRAHTSGPDVNRASVVVLSTITCKRKADEAPRE
jgi:hypothetical protein